MQVYDSTERQIPVVSQLQEIYKHRAIWMEHGKIKAQGLPAEVIEQYISNAHG